MPTGKCYGNIRPETPMVNGRRLLTSPMPPITSPEMCPKVCAEDAKLCPDGSVVSRDPNNNCEFEECLVIVFPECVCPVGRRELMVNPDLLDFECKEESHLKPMRSDFTS
jgi:hypothetical protein